MNRLKFIVPLLVILLSSCCKNVSKNENEGKNLSIKKNVQNPPTTIQENQSIVTAKIQEINLEDKNMYSIKAKILNVEENPAYASMAVEGSVYKLLPDYALDDKNEIDFKMHKEKNNGLVNLSKLKHGDEFKAIIFMGKNYNWYIEKVLN